MKLSNKTLLITGGTGSFGKKMLKHYLKTDIKKIKVFSRDEKKQDDLRKAINDERVNYVIGDVRDKDSVQAVVRGCDYIFHAAALKQVPSCEFFPIEAVKTNVLGTENLLEAAIRAEVKKVVVLSTDKAVYPINAMGISKALMEKVAISKARDEFERKGTIITVTRYGNVLFSRGSIIPFFISLLQKKQDLLVTDPCMTRFLMSLEESVSLVLKSFESGTYGDIFVQKAPATSVENICLALKNIFNSKADINIIGPRHGEKLHETLCSSEEMSKAEEVENYLRIPADLRSIDYKKIDGNQQFEIDLGVSPYSSNTNALMSASALEKMLKEQNFIKEFLL